MRSLWLCVFIEFVSKASFTFGNPQVNLRWMNESCVGGERGLLSTGIWISCNASNVTGVCSTQRQMVAYNSLLPALDSYLENCFTISNVTFEFEQPEHGGGLCHCVEINFTNLTDSFR